MNDVGAGTPRGHRSMRMPGVVADGGFPVARWRVFLLFLRARALAVPVFVG
jgi:hypothetical protein